MVDTVEVTLDHTVVQVAEDGIVLRENGWVAIQRIRRLPDGTAVFRNEGWVGGSGELPPELSERQGWYYTEDSTALFGLTRQAADATKFNAIEIQSGGAGAVADGSIGVDKLDQALRSIVDSVPGNRQADGLRYAIVDQRGNASSIQFSVAKIDVTTAIGEGGVGHALPTYDSDANTLTFTGFDRDGGAVSRTVPLASHDPQTAVTLDTMSSLTLADYSTDDTDTELTAGVLGGDHVAQGITKVGNGYRFANAGAYTFKASLHAQATGGTGGGDRTVIDLFAKIGAAEVDYTRDSMYHRGARTGITDVYDYKLLDIIEVEAGDVVKYFVHPDFEGSGQTLSITSSTLHIMSGAVASITPPARSVNGIKDIIGELVGALRGITFDVAARTFSRAVGWLLPADLDNGTPAKKRAFRDAIGALGAQVQASWTETDVNDPSYIQGKPDIGGTNVDFIDYRADLNTATNTKGIYRHEGSGWQGSNAPDDVDGLRTFEVHTHATDGVQYLVLEGGSAGYYTRATPTGAWSELQVATTPPFNTQRPFVVQGRQEAPASFTPNFEYIDVRKEPDDSEVNDAASNNRRVIQDFQFGTTGVITFHRTADTSKAITGFILSLRNGAATEADNVHTYPAVLEADDGDGQAQATYRTGNNDITAIIKAVSVTVDQRLWFTQLGSVTGEVALTLQYSDGTYSEQHQVAHPGPEVVMSPAQLETALSATRTTLTAGQNQEMITALNAAIRDRIVTWARNATTAINKRRGVAALMNAAQAADERLSWDTAITDKPNTDFNNLRGSVTVQAANASRTPQVLSLTDHVPAGTLAEFRFATATEQVSIAYVVLDQTAQAFVIPLASGVYDRVTIEHRATENDIRMNRASGDFTPGTYSIYTT